MLLVMVLGCCFFCGGCEGKGGAGGGESVTISTVVDICSGEMLALCTFCVDGACEGKSGAGGGENVTISTVANIRSGE